MQKHRPFNSNQSMHMHRRLTSTTRARNKHIPVPPPTPRPHICCTRTRPSGVAELHSLTFFPIVRHFTLAPCATKVEMLFPTFSIWVDSDEAAVRKRGVNTVVAGIRANAGARPARQLPPLCGRCFLPTVLSREYKVQNTKINNIVNEQKMQCDWPGKS
jgi:hypothetical protein